MADRKAEDMAGEPHIGAAIAATDAPVALLRCVHEGAVVWANAAATRLLGLSVGDDLAGAAVRDDVDLLRSFLDSLRGSGSRRVEVVVTNGTPVELLGSLGDDGLVTVAVYSLAAFRDELAQAYQAARTDRLTGLGNRLGFVDGAEAARQQGGPAVVGIADLDGFKQVNDANGHVVGDHVLRHVSRVLTRHAGDDAVVARLGGDEFGLCFVGATAVRRAQRFASAVAADLATGVDLVDGRQLTVSASFGFADCQPGADIGAALHEADIAMYRAKHDRADVAMVHAGDDEESIRVGRTIEQLRRRAETDSRTGLARDHVFERDLPLAVGEGRAAGRPVSVLIADLDHFHDFNATYLYESGHLALRSVAAAMGAAVRDGDRCYRYGGEELGVILPDTDEEAAVEIGDRLRAAVAALEIPHEGRPGGILTVSVGVSAAYPGMPVEPAWLVNGANVAVIAAKDAGRNRTRVAAPTATEPRVRART